MKINKIRKFFKDVNSENILVTADKTIIEITKTIVKSVKKICGMDLITKADDLTKRKIQSYVEELNIRESETRNLARTQENLIEKNKNVKSALRLQEQMEKIREERNIWEQKLENETPIEEMEIEEIFEYEQIRLLLNKEFFITLSLENYEIYKENKDRENFPSTVESLQRLANSFNLLEEAKKLEKITPNEIKILLAKHRLSGDLTNIQYHDLTTAGNAENSYQWIENRLYQINQIKRPIKNHLHAFYMLLTDSKWQKPYK